MKMEALQMIQLYQDLMILLLNACNKNKDLDHMNKIKEQEFQNKEPDYQQTLIAIQGPASQQILQQHMDIDLSKVKFLQHFYTKIDNVPVGLSRTGYTGEDGFEFRVENNYAVQLFDKLLQNKLLKPAGIGARDSLRLEAGFCLHGNDIHEDQHIISSQLKWLIRKNRGDTKFIGQDSLKNYKKDQKRIGFIVEGNSIVRQDSVLIDNDGNQIGKVCSGTYSPILKKGIGMAYVNTNHLKNAGIIKTILRDKEIIIKQVKMPFVQNNYYR